MKLSLITPPNSFLEDLIKPLEELGWTVSLEAESDSSFIIGMSISQLARLKKIRAKFPHIPMINYNWDMYEWILKDKRGYDWDGYADLLRDSIDIWVPSRSVLLRQEEFYGIKQGKVVLTYGRYFEPDEEVRDDRFVLNPMRNQPDRNMGWFERACKEAKIPYLSPDHSLSEAEFRHKVTTCSFIVCPFYEASTGGLTLLEGYRLGKPVLVSDSPYMGARDYFGLRANYYYYYSYPHLLFQLRQMWKKPKLLDREDCKKFTDQFSSKAMAKVMNDRLLQIMNAK